jgi:hypothetical protein
MDFGHHIGSAVLSHSFTYRDSKYSHLPSILPDGDLVRNNGESKC